MWGETNVGVFELVPLRKVDVVEAARSSGILAEPFLKAIADLNVAPLANKPVTLRFLLDAYHQGQSLPTSRAALYTEGCRRLCDEPSQSRRDAPMGRGKLTAIQRYEVASRLAAVTQFSNRYAIWTGPRQSDIPLEDAPLEC